MSEKYITLNHLKTATKSLIAKIDEEINDFDETLSPVAKSGDYEDLENKPNIISDYNELNNTPNIFEIKFYKDGSNWRCSQTYSDINTAINNNAIIIASYANSINDSANHVDFKDYAYNSDFNTYNFYFVESAVDKEDNIIHYTDITFTIDSNNTVSYVETDNSYPIGNNSTPDWDQNDSTADDYIENRTHWKEIDEDYVWVDNESFTWPATTSYALENPLQSFVDGYLSFENNKEYTVIYDEVTYKLTSYSASYSSQNETYIVLGNSNCITSSLWHFEEAHDTDIPFFIYISPSNYKVYIYRTTESVSENATEHTISIIGPKTIYNTLNSQYLNGKLIKYGSIKDAEIFNDPNNIASSSYAHAEGYRTTASGGYSHSEGMLTTASATSSHAENVGTIASGNNTHAEGQYTKAIGISSHSEGILSVASGKHSHAENIFTIASGNGAHSEGLFTSSINEGTHSEGKPIYFNNKKMSKPANSLICTLSEPLGVGENFKNSVTSNNTWIVRSTYVNNNNYLSYWKVKELVFNDNNNLIQFTVDDEYNYSGFISNFKQNSYSNDSISIIFGNLSSGLGAHTEGTFTYASGSHSHAENRMTHAIGDNSHAEGYSTIASSTNQHVQGKYNILDANNVYADIVGNGTDDNTRSNAYTLDWSGNGVYAGKVTVGTAPTADMDVATKLYVDTAMSNVSTDLVGLTDTTITTPTEGQILIYDATSSKWINSNFTAVSAESDTNVNDMLDSFSLDYTSDFLSPNMWVGGSY